jgi:hypothetical protein
MSYFCKACLSVIDESPPPVRCKCGGEVLPMFDAAGAMAAAYLLARGYCCENGCRNCPYKSPKTAASLKTCERCGNRFRCGGEACWCKQVTLTDATRAQLAGTYRDCLCPECLRSIAKSS